jgi:hypothetical protein
VQAVLLPQPVLVTNYSLAPANVTPVNPSRLVANQSGEGKVQLSWDFIEGVSYYVLRGPGLPAGGTRVSGATTFTATGVPAGYQEWSVGSYYEPGAVSTPAAEFPKTGLMVSELVLSGWADLHTHPMVHLAFGGKLIHGGVDVGSPLPQDLSCKGRTNATSIEHALSDDRPSHGGKNWINFTCGDDLRAHHIIPGFQRANDALVTAGPSKPPALGYPEFLHWPKWNDITHQKMWFEWIRRARDGGLRVMVALATNNKTLGDAVSGPGDGPTDDKTSGDLQLTELKAFVGRHPDFMEVAYGPADVKRIVQSNRIAVVLGVELDNIGNFNLPELRPLMSGPAGYGIIAGEIQRLYTLGVRYVIPIHVIDNQFGGTAIYENGFNRSNLREAGHFWEIECAKNSDGITYTYNEEYDLVKAMAAFVKIGMDPFRRSGPGPDCSGPGKGPHRNARGLTLQGIFAIKEMMKRGMIVDIDHMSQYSADATLDLGEKFGYPIVSGHNGIRGYGSDHASENQRTQRQLQRISRLHGMFGLGTDGVHQSSWANQYEYALNIMGYQHSDTLNALYRVGAVAFGTDLNGLVQGPPPSRKGDVYPGWLEPSTSGSKTWRYSDDGVAHYGMMADFVRGVSLAPANTYGGRTTPGMTGSDLVNHHLNRNANYFWQMWQRIEARKGSVQ